ncbi:hypothetical protein DQ04_09531010, partial [Trypanosoma grayi]|uniref:hypothetical protein n=1 Tax=Trypanosoma grayi TaxID=71804 RepID=UPI0004F4BB94
EDIVRQPLPNNLRAKILGCGVATVEDRDEGDDEDFVPVSDERLRAFCAKVMQERRRRRGMKGDETPQEMKCGGRSRSNSAKGSGPSSPVWYRCPRGDCNFSGTRGENATAPDTAVTARNPRRVVFTRVGYGSDEDGASLLSGDAGAPAVEGSERIVADLGKNDNYPVPQGGTGEGRGPATCARSVMGYQSYAECDTPRLDSVSSIWYFGDSAEKWKNHHLCGSSIPTVSGRVGFGEEEVVPDLDFWEPSTFQMVAKEENGVAPGVPRDALISPVRKQRDAFATNKGDVLTPLSEKGPDTQAHGTRHPTYTLKARRAIRRPSFHEIVVFQPLSVAGIQRATPRGNGNARPSEPTPPLPSLGGISAGGHDNGIVGGASNTPPSFARSRCGGGENQSTKSPSAERRRPRPPLRPSPRGCEEIPSAGKSEYPQKPEHPDGGDARLAAHSPRFGKLPQLTIFIRSQQNIDARE